VPAPDLHTAATRSSRMLRRGESQAGTVEKRVGKVGRGEGGGDRHIDLQCVKHSACTLALGMGSRVPQTSFCQSRDSDPFAYRLDDRLAVRGAVGARLGTVELRVAWQNRPFRLAFRSDPMRGLLLRLHTPAPSISIVCS